jgi:hypothetical protein
MFALLLIQGYFWLDPTGEMRYDATPNPAKHLARGNAHVENTRTDHPASTRASIRWKFRFPRANHDDDTPSAYPSAVKIQPLRSSEVAD